MFSNFCIKTKPSTLRVYDWEAAEEETINEVEPIGSADMKSGSEGLRNMNYAQLVTVKLNNANY